MLQKENNSKKKLKDLEEKILKKCDELEKAKVTLIKTLEKTKEAEKKFEEEKNKTRAALISLADGLIVFDKEKKITLVNPVAEKVLELKEKNVLNKTINEISGYPNLDKLYRALGGEIEWTGRRYELTLDGLLKRYFYVSITPVVVAGEEVGLMVVFQDITREEEISHMKTEFVSIAAHQLRTPLSAIKWILRMLLDGDVGKLSKEQIDFLERGYQSNERMILLINDLLNVAHIEEGRFIYEPSLLFLEDIARKNIAILGGIAKKRDIEIVFNELKDGSSKEVKADRKKMELVFQNLLDNAIRFTDPGGKVTISIGYDKISAKVMIKDTGVGIPKEQQSRIFTKFFRANNVVKMETEGTGLGLFICKNIINAHNGKIWFESKENEGTAFYFTIPLNSKL
ncbi:PAS domain-containing sensor histidine kinase [Patescibacteria group bacterium]|nr:PAS domain-containing sensor histidine kinase [Patescibacteria group bacterium]MBU2579638.1 PAS domain-containing sensor histidine kinase [Patescibacteria group bacterium]